MKKSKSIGLKRAALLSLGIVCISASLWPAQADEVYPLGEVVVSSTRSEQKVKDTPASVQVITRKDIDTMGADSVVSALKLAIDLNLSQAGMTGNQVSLRGMNSNQSLILIDGRRLAGEDTGSTANVYELNRININDVERIEIVRGPVSSLYGSDALGGVINVIMRHPGQPHSSIGLAEGSRQSSASYHADFGKQGKWAWQLDTLFTDVKKISQSDSTNMYGPRQFYNLSGTYELTPDKHLDVFFEHMNEHLQSDFTDASRDFFDNTRNSYGATYRGKTQYGNYEFRTYYNELEKNNDTQQSTGRYSDFDRARYKTWVVDGKNTFHLNDNHVLTVGGEYRTNTYRGTRLEDNGDDASVITEHGLSKPISEKQVDYQALYAQDEWKLSDKLFVIPSLRYDGSNKFADSLSPKLGLTYKIHDTLRLKTNFGKGFKAPSISELYLKMTHRPIPGMTVYVLGNPNLDPERSTSYDVSLEGEYGKNFGKLTYFNNDVTDLIGTNTTHVGRVYTSQYINVDKASISGVEWEGGRHLSKKFTLLTSYTYLDAKNAKNNQRLDNRAKNQYTVQLRYDDGERTGVNGILWQEWVQDYRYSGVDYNYTTLNFTLNKQWNARCSTYFGIDNILNKKIDELVLDGRQWRFGITYTL